MSDEVKKIDSVYIRICTVIFGTDETLLKIKLNNGFEFRKMSLIPHVDNLDKIFDISAMGLRRKYETAKINNNLQVVCAFKKMVLSNSSEDKQSNEFFSKICDDALKTLDNDIRCIRLSKEATVRFKILSIIEN